MKELKKMGLIYCDGVDNKNFKIWKLTEKGKEVVKHLKRIEELV
ncbi:MAG: hypothetical protein QXH03_10865 [Candidatus Bathyarchaeia archaeon]